MSLQSLLDKDDRDYERRARREADRVRSGEKEYISPWQPPPPPPPKPERKRRPRNLAQEHGA